MAGCRLTPDQTEQASVMREAGYTLAAIADRLHTSPRTLQRLFKSYGVTSGGAKAELIQKARQELLEAATGEKSIKHQIARLLKDDVSNALSLREKAALAIESLNVTDHLSATETARALTAISTAMKNTQEVLWKTLDVDKARVDQEADELPELRIVEMTAKEAEAEAQRQKDLMTH